MVDLLRELMQTQVTSGAGDRPRDQQSAYLDSLCDSDLERRFVRWLDAEGYRLPDDAQRTVTEALARPDFVYRLSGTAVAVFVDGPHHDGAVQQQRDGAAAERLDDLGWSVVRIRYDEDWSAAARQREWVFGSGRAS